MEPSLVWLVSPDPDMRRLIGLNLSKRGYRILEASSLGELSSHAQKPYLVILDVEPSDESQWEEARALRRRPQAQGVPLILLQSAAPTARQLIPIEPVWWLEKPLAIDALLTLVRECLGGHGSQEPHTRSKKEVGSDGG